MNIIETPDQTGNGLYRASIKVNCDVDGMIDYLNIVVRYARSKQIMSYSWLIDLNFFIYG